MQLHNTATVAFEPPPARVEDAAIAALYRRRIVFLRSAIADDVASLIAAQLMALDNAAEEPITLLIDSPGGDISGLFTIHDTMHALASPVDTVCMGMAASAAAVLLATGTGTRRASQNARIMLHQPHGGIPTGTAKDIEIAANQFSFLRLRLEEILADRTGRPLDQIRADTDRDHWLSAPEALDYGVIDEVIEPQSRADRSRE